MSEETIFREVDEELRRDRLRHGWRRYGFYVIGAAVLVVLVVAANEGWSWWQGSNAARSSDQFYAALSAEDGGDLAAAGKALDTLIAQGTGRYPELAKFKQASLLARQGKTADAQAAYDALASAESNSRLKELALLFAANLLVDKGDVDGIKSRIEGLLSPDDPLHNAASETIGLAEYKAGDLNAARDSFAAVLTDPQASSATRGRMQLYIGQLVAQGATPPGAPADATPASTTPPSAAATSSSTTPAPAPAAASVSPPAASDSTTPVGVESSQPSVPDAALDMATPAPAATAPATPASSDSSIPLLSTGAGLPSVPPPDDTSQPAGTVSVPAAAPPASAAPAPAAAMPASAAGATPAPAPAATPAPAAAAPLVPTTPAGK